MDGDYENTALLTTIPLKFLFGQPVALMHNEMKSDNSSTTTWCSSWRLKGRFNVTEEYRCAKAF
jgi:hypothetical protein